MPGRSRLTFGVVLAAAGAIGCSGNGAANPLGTGGSGGGTGGSTGTGGSGGGGTPFMAVQPCTAESSYATTGTTIQFGVNGAHAYEPSCLQVAKGATVTFSGEFGLHPLVPSTMRGTTAGNPIISTPTGTSASFTFPDSGFYAYFCSFHGSDDGLTMAGVIWAN
jgi:plastocyanin